MLVNCWTDQVLYAPEVLTLVHGFTFNFNHLYARPTCFMWDFILLIFSRVSPLSVSRRMYSRYPPLSSLSCDLCSQSILSPFWLSVYIVIVLGMLIWRCMALCVCRLLCTSLCSFCHLVWHMSYIGKSTCYYMPVQ